jgi:hypothetical protein
VIAPAAAELQILRRVTLLLKAETTHEPKRCHIVGLYVGLEPMQAIAPKGGFQDELEGSRHVSVSVMRDEGVIT